LKYELRRCEVKAMDKIAEDLEDAARQHNSQILSWQVNKLRGSSQSGLCKFCLLTSTVMISFVTLESLLALHQFAFSKFA